MLILLSPAKTLNEDPSPNSRFSICDFLSETAKLLPYLKKLSRKKIMALMDISEKLAELNFSRYQNFVLPDQDGLGKQAIYSFEGDVYQNMDVKIWNSSQETYAQNNLRILSGLYGLLRPFDLMSPYRLEMGTALKTGRGKNLYQFWGERITKKLNQEIEESSHDCVVNLASIEYASVVQPEKLKAPFIQVDFKEIRDGQLKTIALNSKRARGKMAQYLIMNQAKTLQEIQSFCEGGYLYDSSASKPDHLLFVKA
ncbi:MAG: peroxide stress protein YaaA [Candidatus Cloacimonetes bacterium]|nr:peroxide stress protein YaaA [Candidatus Cloacimonadota bacterium]